MTGRIITILLILISYFSFPEQAMACGDQNNSPHQQEQTTKHQKETSNCTAECCQRDHHKHADGEESNTDNSHDCSPQHCFNMCHSVVSTFAHMQYELQIYSTSKSGLDLPLYIYPIYQNLNHNVWIPPRIA
ncbi:hypothetical protein [Sphingobacterium psychroaquaticum]|nr:hypothetical protein [Sphingobacterium psychroaquaticum]QBQ42250.1 hypothetical protein E2P86_14300 [Sphingobacterium psychroaquaticum]